MKRAVLIDFGISMIVLIAMIFSSCKKEKGELENKQLKIDQLLKFVSVKDRIPNTHSREIIIVSWSEWGRAKKDCDGWGLCNAHWFPEFNMGQNPVPPMGSASILERNSVTRKYYIDILLAEPPPIFIPLQDLTLMIDADIVLDSHSETGHDLLFRAGQYPINISMGNFGGYRLYLD